ncbi:MAG: 7-cyano-7-deazaguanine synthase QueC [Bdellovibrionaceae bacterium]|nr:7-cyano-7-deazaguanine synthase QueC [Pseudobdellovibrionaceae bacterium]MBX3033880.1 7-cyano-7-deazaguanine synthase QueC [Pseudobdellovibrionaceae bacterium]
MKVSAVVLLSAGLDSTTNLYAARDAGWDVRLALTLDYGQRAARREVAASQSLAARLNIPHRVLELPFFRDIGQSSLLDRTREVPVGDEVSMDDHGRSLETAKSVWVPNRNGILLNIAAGYAEALGAQVVVPGFNAEEGATFPDNTPAFMKALDGSFAYSTSNHVRVGCFTQDLDKPAIAVWARDLGVDFSWLWPCYFDGARPCGRCESCQRDKRAFRAAGADVNPLFEDPT